MTRNSTMTKPQPICGIDTMMPVTARIVAVKEENFNTRTFRVEIVDQDIRRMYQWTPGQFNMLYAPGVGEAAISISSDSEQPQFLEHTIRVVGSVTRAITKMGEGATLGVRGPFGRAWPLDQLDGRDVVVVAGGIGLAPLRPVIYYLLKHRDRYRRVILLYGARTPADRLYSDELAQWDAAEGIDVLVSVDNATPGWVGPVGVVTKLLQRIKVNAARTSVLVCGPHILNRVAALNFIQLHVPPNQVFVSLERNMQCGFGRCGHCQYGGLFVCKDGPVFSFAEIAHVFTDEEI